MRPYRRIVVGVVFVLGLWLWFPLAAGAQSAPSGESKQTGDATLEDIEVTARKIPEKAHEVPFSVTTVTARDMEDGHVQNSRDLTRIAPGFHFTDSGLKFANLLNIRGVGSSSAMITPAVVYAVDGVPIPVRVFDQRFLDVSRIEILRGPQGTLFGLNAQAGVVNIHTTDPPSRWSAELGGELFSYGGRQVTGKIGGPVSDMVSICLNGVLYGYNGDIPNYVFSSSGAPVSTDREVRAESLGAFSGKAVITPDADTKITLSGTYRNDWEKPTTGVWTGFEDSPRNAFNPVPKSVITNQGLGLTVEHDFGWAKLTAISGFQHYDIDFSADIMDGYIGSALTRYAPYNFQMPTMLRAIPESSTQLSQEIRLDGKTDGGVQWVAGVSGLSSDFKSATDIISPSMASGSYAGKLDTTNLALFGEVTVPLAERLRFIAGLRGSYENKTFDGSYLGLPGLVSGVACFDQTGNKTYTFLTGRTGLSFDLTPDFTAFATVARGEKTGGYLFYNQYASSGAPLRPYESAVTWSYELGVRGKPGLDWLEVGASAFLNETENEQLFTYNPVSGVFSVQNANTETYGAEIEAKTKPIDHLTLSGNLALLHAKIVSGSGLCGKDVPYAPSVSAGLAAEYRYPLKLASLEGSVFGRVEYQYVGDRAIDPANSLRLDEYGLVNLRAGWGSDHFDVYAYASNVFDTKYTTSAYKSGTATSGQAVFAGVPGAPCTVGVGVRLKF